MNTRTLHIKSPGRLLPVPLITFGTCSRGLLALPKTSGMCVTTSSNALQFLCVCSRATLQPRGGGSHEEQGEPLPRPSPPTSLRIWQHSRCAYMRYCAALCGLQSAFPCAVSSFHSRINTYNAARMYTRRCIGLCGLQNTCPYAVLP